MISIMLYRTIICVFNIFTYFIFDDVIINNTNKEKVFYLVKVDLGAQ